MQLNTDCIEIHILFANLQHIFGKLKNNVFSCEFLVHSWECVNLQWKEEFI